MRRTHGVRRRLSLKPEVCTERARVDAAGISVKAGAQYSGRFCVVARESYRRRKALGAASPPRAPTVRYPDMLITPR
jgi:hypothetical protein